MDDFKIGLDDNYIIISLKYSSFVGIRHFYIKRKWFNKEINEKLVSWFQNEKENIEISISSKPDICHDVPECEFELNTNPDGSVFYNMNVKISFEGSEIEINLQDQRNIFDMFDYVPYSNGSKISKIINEYFSCDL